MQRPQPSPSLEPSPNARPITESPEIGLNHAPAEAWRLFQNIPVKDRDLYFGTETSAAEEENGREVANLLLEWTKKLPCDDMFDDNDHNNSIFDSDYEAVETLTAGELMMMEKRARAAFEMYKDKFPTAIWHCCKGLCFTSIAIDPHELPLLRELMVIHNVAEDMHKDIKCVPNRPETRRKGVGGSKVFLSAPTRKEREETEGIFSGSDRQRLLHRLATFVVDVLPFLYGEEEMNGCNTKKLCTGAICELLGISRSFLYLRRKVPSSQKPGEYELSSLVDKAGIRLRQNRRDGDRSGYPAIADLPAYDCGCEVPCLGQLHITYLQNEYKAFSVCAEGLHPRQKENLYLLKVMFSPLTNSPVKQCDKAISALYTVSEGVVAKVRSVLQQMCDDEDANHRELLENGMEAYSMRNRHPIYRYGPHIREKVEKHLDFVLRADPAGGKEHGVCRVYSPEINTKEKLRKSIAESLQQDKEVKGHLSESTLQRMVDKYLKDRKCIVSFSQKDHNACPICKTQNYAALQYSHEVKKLQREYETQFGGDSQIADEESRVRMEELKKRIEMKRFQEDRSVKDLEAHSQRDAEIRKTIKLWSDKFRGVEAKYLEDWEEGKTERVWGWNSLSDHAMITHQDDMTKVDLPHFLVDVSSDITRWRFDVNAHVSSVNGDSVIFSHEQGTGSKTASSIAEMILLDHIVRCKGEAIKVVVSDNASVGKNWLTTIALPQYIVDQGLASIVFIVFLENNHGKWLADMLFGQLQTRRKRSTLLSVDSLLREFEAINRKNGNIQGFAVNPLTSIDFSAVFESLGYEVKPSKDFGFVKRNIHFTAACKQTAKDKLPPDLRRLFGQGLPDEEGMVRISCSPPTNRKQSELYYEERYVDVPAARLTKKKPNANEESDDDDIDPPLEEGTAPLVVPMDKKFKESGPGLVSQRTAQHVGFNGIGFKKYKGYPELKDQSSKLVRQAWPVGFLKPNNSGQTPDEPIAASESTKCAPENWIIRRPVGHFGVSDRKWKARYPPRNLLNATYGKGPREASLWIPTQTYHEPPFPLLQKTSACKAMQRLSERHSDISKSLNLLDMLKEVYQRMGDRDGVSDPWLQKRATIPSPEAQLEYREALQIHIERNRGDPASAKTVRQLFKEDEEVRKKVENSIPRQGSAAEWNKAKTREFAKLFREAEGTPGALDKYTLLMEIDVERYSAELRVFHAKQREFDRERGLLPTSASVD